MHPELLLDLGVRDELLARHPWLAEELFRAFSAARDSGLAASNAAIPPAWMRRNFAVSSPSSAIRHCSPTAWSRTARRSKRWCLTPWSRRSSNPSRCVKALMKVGSAGHERGPPSRSEPSGTSGLPSAAGDGTATAVCVEVGPR